MPTINYAVTISGLGGSIQRTTPRTGEGGIVAEVPLPAGKTGQLTTRTDNETGTLTMSGGHGITTGAIIDLYWATGARFGILVGTVATNSVPIGADNSGTGDNLPTNLTNVVASVQVPFNVAIDGDELGLVCLQNVYANNTATDASRIGFLDGTNDPIASIKLTGNTPRVFDVEGGDSNPFTGDPITHAVASNGSSSAASVLKIYGVQDATP